MEKITNARDLVNAIMESKIMPGEAVEWIEDYARKAADQEKPLTDLQIKELRNTCKTTLIERMEREWYLKEGGSKLIDLNFKEALESLGLPKNVTKVKQKYYEQLDQWMQFHPAEGW